MNSRRTLLFGTVFWGNWHRDAFIDIELPSLLSAGNLPRIAANNDIVFRILTTRCDRLVLETSQAYQRLLKHARVEIVEENDFSAERRFPIHHRFWNECIANARALNALLFLLPPDLCFSDGSMLEIARRLISGKAAVYVTGLRVAAETFIPAARRDFYPAAGPWRDVSGAELAQAALDHSHPFNNALRADSPHSPYISEMTLYPVDASGWIKHCFIAGPIMFFDPDKVELNHSQVVTAVRGGGAFDVIFDDDDAAFVSIAPLTLYGEWYVGEGPESDFRKAIRRALSYRSLSSAEVARDMFEISPRRSDRSTGIWQETAAKAKAHAARINALVNMLVLADGCRRGGLAAFAELVGLLAVLGHELPTLEGNANYICVFPQDSEATRRGIERLLKDGGIAAAATHVGRHIFHHSPGQQSRLRNLLSEPSALRLGDGAVTLSGRPCVPVASIENFAIYGTSEHLH